ncbi:hypothetical protein vseg_014819 [Gypsophila vaccaria]
MNFWFIDTTEHPTPNPDRSRTYTTTFFDTRITTVVTSTPAVARSWVYNLRKTHRRALSNSSLVVGLGVQWTATRGPKGSRPKAATLQLSVGGQCLVFQLGQARAVPATLRRLLEDERVTFVGVHNGRDRTLLKESWAQLEVWDLVDVAKAEGFGNKSMENICGDVLGLHGIVKPKKIGLSNWDGFWLSFNQVEYACVDAHVAYLLGTELGYPKHDDRYDYGYDGSGYRFNLCGGYSDYEDYSD